MQKPTELLETYEPTNHKHKSSATNKTKQTGTMKTNTEKVRHQMDTTTIQNSKQNGTQTRYSKIRTQTSKK